MDNLDRCRPEFVLNLLVVLKRLFDVNGMTFLLSYDKQQIINLLHAQYGKNVDIQSYIKKYIAYEYYMPQYTKEIHNFTFRALKNSYSPQDPLIEIFQEGEENFDIVWNTLTNLDPTNQLLSKDDTSKFLLAYIWQHLFLKSILSLRKYEQGFLHIRQAIYLKEVENHIIYIMLLYIKFNFPSEYQAILYRIDELSGYSMFNDDFLEKMNKIYTVLSNRKDNQKKSFADLFGDEVSKSIIRQAYAMIELHSMEDEAKV